MGKGFRTGRLGEEIKKVISQMLLRDIKDPRLSEAMVSLSDVEVTSDGSYATCYVTVLSTSKDEEAKQKIEEDVLAGLRSAKGPVSYTHLDVYKRQESICGKEKDKRYYRRNIRRLYDGQRIRAV